MTNKELQKILKEYPDTAVVFALEPTDLLEPGNIGISFNFEEWKYDRIDEIDLNSIDKSTVTALMIY